MRRGTGSERRTRWRVNVEPTFHARAVMPPLATGGRYRPLPAGPEASTPAMRRDKGAGMDDHSYLRAGAVAAVAGAVLGAVGNLLHPRYGDIPDFRIYRKIAASSAWRPADAILVVAVILTVAGFVAVAHSLEGRG